jgi:EAL domain-containing protein (putative c-di-GMP-specific phosphodiesterase class I)
MVGPGEFIPIAEESGFIIDLDFWVLEEACRQAQAWLRDGLPPVRLSVNLSGRHFTAPERIVGSVCAVLARTGFDPAWLELEVTEGVSVSESEEVAEALGELRALGVGIAIDDFGTGYSALGRLHRFPVDRLKIDQSFVANITSAETTAPLVVAIVAMARGLGLETIAEGVETAEQRDYLRGQGCDHAQGYFFAEPRDAAAIAQLLEPPPATSTDVTSQS